MAVLQYFLLVLYLIEVAKGASRYRRMVNGVQEGSLVNGTVHNPGNLSFVVFITAVQHYIGHDEVTQELVWYSSPAQCGGAIIREDVILTAAHCIKNTKTDTVRIHAGIVHKEKPQESKQVGTAKHLVTHEEYKGGWEFDLGLVFMENKFILNYHVKLINLPRADDYSDVSATMAAGWGRDENGIPTDWLRSAQFSITDNVLCQLHTQHVLTDKELCVIGKLQNMTVCKGDSGGPLFHRNVVLGVASNVIGNPNQNGSCRPQIPAVFVKVLNYIDWINQRLEANGMDMDVFRKVQLMRSFLERARKKTRSKSN